MIRVLFDVVFTDAAVFGDTNLELPSVVSNRSVVEVHIDVDLNIVSGHSNGLEINVEVPLHARYPVCEKNSGFSLEAKKVIIIVGRSLCLIKVILSLLPFFFFFFFSCQWFEIDKYACFTSIMVDIYTFES